MEKDLIITFLNEHWDEFIGLLADMDKHDYNMPLMERVPDHLYEFAALLHTVVASYQNQQKNTQLRQEIAPEAAVSANWVPDDSFECCDADNRGLLEKAQNFRRGGNLRHDEHTARSIIIKNGLFIVQQQQNRNQLNTAFKNLVDSVL